jgi:hypothetical protein
VARTLAAGRYSLVRVSAQPAAAKGKITVRELLVVHERVLGLMAAEDVRFDAWRLCRRHPTAWTRSFLFPALAASLLQACSSMPQRHWLWTWTLPGCWGDADTDVLTGQAASCRTGLLAYPGSAHKRAAWRQPDLLATDLHDAVYQLPGQSAG